ncbi:TPA: tail length tape measure protein [Acinetobacter baumannii]|uniref:tail length tape measure protein n=1 Tax=Acinetobacter baumannii TaxID=470 RepID=UPI00124A3723|nr:tail length tape measure protein [Acinetobacter baumannii]KAB1608904.1 tail length tape measure protein [Acinetobacter baumannii]MEB6639002.1 tail length tape measure protein [Acinetobacter baumannii]HCA5310004.1 tail length tape measure protein [Acinetobacter baumannii]HEO1845880.1 tail length tape measure protein [Acinetobacter baumannii]
MAGEINNTLKLDINQFDQAIQKASDRLDKLDSNLGKTNASVESLEKILSGLGGDIRQLSSSFKTLDDNLAASLKMLSGVQKNTDSLSRSLDSVDKSASKTAKTTAQAAKSIENLADFTQAYEKKLKNLNPLLNRVSKGQQILEAHAKATGDELEKQSKRTLANNARALQAEIKNNEKLLAERREMAYKAAQIQKRAEVNLAVQQKLYNGTFFGKNKNSTSEKAVEMRANIELWRKEADAAKLVKEQIKSVIRDIEYQNGELQKGVNLLNQQIERTRALKNQQSVEQAKSRQEQKSLDTARKRQELEKRTEAWWKEALYNRERREEEAERRRIEKRRQLEQEYSNWFNRELDKRERREADARLKQRPLIRNIDEERQAQTRTADARRKLELDYTGWWTRTLNNRDQAAQRAAEQAERDAHRVRMQQLNEERKAQELLHREQMSVAKDLAAMYASIKINQGLGGAVHKNMELEQSKFRLAMWNLPKEEQERFLQKSRDLTKTEKYLTNAEAIDARLDAMAAMGGNHEKTIDATLATATRVAHILRATGNETGSNSDLVKNLYGFAESRQVMNNVDEINKSFETLLKISNISNGKIKIADVETIARNMGGMRADVSADGWLKIAALGEQFKTAGGGNGGGGGIATVGTMLKMMGLYGSGKTITNRAVTDLMGADILNEFKDGDAEKAFRENAKNIKEFTKMMKNAGFKDLKSMGEDPVKFFSSLRGQILDYMMREDNFARFFGEGTKRWTYNQKGQMINSEGKVVDPNEQNKIERTGFTRWASGMGWSNKTVDGLTTMLDKRFIDRANEVAESAKRSAESQQALKAAQDTLKGSTDNLMASLGRLAESFAPLLPVLTGFVNGLTKAVDGVANLMNLHPAIAIVTGLGVGFGALTLATSLFFGKLNLLSRLVSTFLPALGGLGKIAQTSSGQLATATSTANNLGQAVSKMGDGTKNVVPKVANMSTRVLGILGGMLRWAGWVGLGLLVGQMFISWLDSVNKNETPLRSSFQRLVQGLRDDLIAGLKGLHTIWNNALIQLGIDTENARRNLRDLANYKGEVLKIPVKGVTAEEGGGFTSTPATRELGKKITKLLEKRELVQKGKGFLTNALDGGKQQLKDIDATLAEYRRGMKLGGLVYIEKGPYAGQVVLKKEIEKNAKLLKNKQKQEAAAKSASTSSTGSVLPTPSNLADYSAPAIGSGGGSTPKEKTGRGYDRQWNNLYRADVEKALLGAQDRETDISEILGQPVDYLKRAKNDFIERWMSGKWDDNNDPRSRPFTKGTYNPDTGWTKDQIDWDGMYKGQHVNEFLNAQMKKLMADDYKASIQFAAERSASTDEDFKNVLDQFVENDAKKSDALMALERQFARYEVRNPMALQAGGYNDLKDFALNHQVAKDTLSKAYESKNINKQLSIDLMDSEVDRRQSSADYAYDEVAKEINEQRKALEKRIQITKTMMENDETAKKEYAELIKAKELAEEEFTKRLMLENEKRVRASESATQQMLRQYRDLKVGIESINQKWTESAIDSVADLITGRMSFKDLDWRQIGSDIFADYAKVFVKDSASKLITNVMGNQSIFDLGKSLLSGKAAGGMGWASDLLNRWRGLGPYAPAVDPNTGESTSAAVNTEITDTIPLFDKLRATLNPLTQGLSSLWENVSSASQGLWTFASDAISKAINALFQWATSLLASSTASSGSSGGNWLGTLFQVGMAAYGAYSGAGAGIGDISSGASYQVGGGFNSAVGWSGTSQFAKGGIFTNSIVNEPTPFMFAKGGSFANGLMGEAGPEAIMPLTRDSSGRLGVSMLGAGDASNVMQNHVQIQITVNNDGSSSTSASGGDAQEYKQMAKQVEAIVMSTLDKQSRPGGRLYKK